MKNKNKIIMLVMILLVLSLVSVSFVIAGPLDALKNLQEKAASSGLIVIIVNAIAIFAGLTLIFNLLKKGMEKKQSNIVQIGIAVFSFMIAMELNVSDLGMFIWKIRYFANLIHPQVIVNGVVIGAALIGLSAILLENQMKTQAVKWIVRIIAVMMALSIVMSPFVPDKTWDDVKDSYKYVWQESFWIRTKFFLFGDFKCTHDDRTGCYDNDAIERAIAGENTTGYSPSGRVRWGILVGRQLLVFVLTLLVLAGVFKTFAKKDMFGDKFWYLVAAIVAGYVANTGVDFGKIFWLLEVVIIFLLYRSMVAEGARKGSKIVASIFAIFLVEIVAYFLLPGRKVAIFYGPISTIMDVFKGEVPATHLIWIGGGLIGLIILFLVILGISKKTGWIGKIISDSRVYGFSAIRAWAQRRPWLNWLFRYGWSRKEKTPEGELANVHKRVSMELEWLMHYMLRLEVYMGKWKTVKNAVDIAGEINKELEGEYSFSKIARFLEIYKNGCDFDNNNGKSDWKLIPREMTYVDEKGDEHKEKVNFIGWNNHFYTIVKLLDELKARLSKTSNLTSTKHEFFEDFKTTVDDDIKGTNLTLMNDNKKWYNIYLQRFKAIHKLRSKRNEMINQYCLYGLYEHRYKFAKPTAEYYERKYNVDNNGRLYFTDKISELTPKKPIGRSTLVKDEKLKPMHLEVDYFGRVIEDLHKVLVKGEKPAYVRQIRPENVIELNFKDVMKWLDLEWKGFVYDVRDGRYHPYSKRSEDYENAHAKGNFNYKTIKRVSDMPTDSGNPAFDRGGLKDPGGFVYLGREKYNETDLDAIKRSKYAVTAEDGKKIVFTGNPLPTVTNIGLSRYITDLFHWKIAEDEEAIKQLQMYIYDNGRDTEMFTNYLREEKK